MKNCDNFIGLENTSVLFGLSNQLKKGSLLSKIKKGSGSGFEMVSF